MLTTQRKQRILARLHAQGQVIAKALSQELGTSEDTVRRDLRELAAEGKLQRVHGGALPASPAIGNTLARGGIAHEDKIALGKLGASLIKPGQVALLDGGTTALQLAQHIAPDLRATIVTHSPVIATALAAHAHIDIIMLGGKLFRHSMVNMGAQTVEAVSQLHIDLYVMGVTGVHPTAGLTTGDYEEAALKRAFHARAAETVVLASGEKLLAASAYAIAPMQALAALVVTAHTPDETKRVFETLGVKLLLAA
jgi:DeoR/GlpR family transcriptional regulator of sugar metabolism